MPSSARRLRSRMTTAPTSPTPEPSTYTSPAGTELADSFMDLAGDFNDAAVVGDGDVIAVHAHLLSQLAVDLQHPLLTVERDEEPGLRQGVDDLQLLLAGVAGDVEHIRPVIDHRSALAEQLVDDPAHRDLVAGNGGGGEDDLVAGADLHLLVGGEGHAVQGAHFLALRAGGDDDLLVLGQALDAC